MSKLNARTSIAAIGAFGALGAVAISPAIANADTDAPATEVLTAEQAQAVEINEYGFWSEVGGGAAKGAVTGAAGGCVTGAIGGAGVGCGPGAAVGGVGGAVTGAVGGAIDYFTDGD
ncbi:hypothetical protein [uncultured Corynebacterium sp.]|uniref:hypothetical protein n=1 Tax=uncultured Corynebacterium sp. TaxID=159447 RepID=UPI00262BC034|nr:hypothetical protein [uncultured Corynebacterium sp.]